MTNCITLFVSKKIRINADSKSAPPSTANYITNELYLSQSNKSTPSLWDFKYISNLKCILFMNRIVKVTTFFEYSCLDPQKLKIGRFTASYGIILYSNHL